MERKIGEIFNINNDWYQVVKSNGECCKGCAFYEKGCKAKYADVGSCGTSREDWTQVIFKKLEKVGEPYVAYGKVRQQYKLHAPLTITNGIIDKDMSCDDVNLIVDIELKQNKEDMEEKKLNLKPFDLEAAKSGKPVCTRDWHKARIICFDRKSDTSIVALIMGDNDREEIHSYYKDGKSVRNQEYSCDLMMYPEKKEGWVNVMEGTAGKVYVGNDIYKTEDEAKEGASRFTSKLIASVPIEWEE